MSELNYQEIGKSLLPVFNSLVNSLFDGDFEVFLKHHPPTSEDSFNEAVSILKPLGKPVNLEYLCHLAKLDRVKMLCKVTYDDTIEELVWDFNFRTEGDEFHLVNLGFDK